LIFRLEGGCFEPDQRMLAIWERYVGRHPALLDEYRQLILAHYGARNSRDGATVDDDAFRQVHRGTVVIARTDEEEESLYTIDVSFDVEWELEHPVGFALDENGNIVDELQ
jgi:hypothetical protein